MTRDQWSTEQPSRLHHGNHALTSSGIRSCKRSLGTRSWIQGIFSRSFRWKRVGGPTQPSRGRGSGGPTETLLSVSSLSLLLTSFFIRVKGGGASGNAWRRHPSRLFFMAIRTIGPGDRTEGCPRSECAGWLAALKAKWNGQRERSRDFLPWSHWSSIRSRRNRRGSCPTGSEVPSGPSGRIASWELSMTAPRGALDSLRENDKQSGTNEERDPDVKI